MEAYKVKTGRKTLESHIHSYTKLTKIYPKLGKGNSPQKVSSFPVLNRKHFFYLLYYTFQIGFYHLFHPLKFILLFTETVTQLNFVILHRRERGVRRESEKFLFISATSVTSAVNCH